jgi:hypothetical protein
MMRNVSRCLLLLMGVVAVAVGLPGCGRTDLHRVSGRVHFADGSPLRYGRVVVDYAGAHKGAAWGSVKRDGTFTIGTLQENDGMRAGTYRVAVKGAVVPLASGENSTGAELIHSRFSDPQTSGLSFEVPKQTKWDIVVEKP